MARTKKNNQTKQEEKIQEGNAEQLRDYEGKEEETDG